MFPRSGPQIAKRLFAPIAPGYERWAALLSLGQDARWRRRMVAGLDLPPGALVLDVAAGTGSISRALEAGGCQVVALDLSSRMLDHHPGRWRILGRGDQLPFRAESFDGVTFGYLLRYVDDPRACVAELARVLRPGGKLGMIEFGLPRGGWHSLWRIYTGWLLPLFGRLISPGWAEVGRFLRGSIESFHQRWPEPGDMWTEAGLVEVKTVSMSLGGGLVMWGRKP
ncbi:MAG TPA: class I SAM-dependent methyltransferase [Acidimicrobiia bacterium]|nr:class I SAM-dependent methyltransferase [Acidimicrobiia bacterium]